MKSILEFDCVGVPYKNGGTRGELKSFKLEMYNGCVFGWKAWIKNVGADGCWVIYSNFDGGTTLHSRDTFQATRDSINAWLKHKKLPYEHGRRTIGAVYANPNVKVEKKKSVAVSNDLKTRIRAALASGVTLSGAIALLEEAAA